MISILIFVYFLLGLWSAERFCEAAQDSDMSWGLYAASVLFWPAFWIMAAIAADIPETDTGDDDESEND